MRQIWIRVPGGTETQVTNHGVSSYVEGVGPNGEVLFINFPTTSSASARRFLATPSSGYAPVDIGGGYQGKAFFQSGNVYEILGNTLFQIVP